jgi:hypothetical protein
LKSFQGISLTQSKANRVFSAICRKTSRHKAAQNVVRE